MKKLLVVVLAALPFVAYAQMPGMQMPNMQDLPEATIVSETESMVAQYGLNEDQAAKLLDLNKQYLGKVSYPVILPPEAEEAMKNASANRPAGGAGGFNMGNMTQEDRDQMMSMMNQMQDMMAQIEENQTAYEDGLASILDKKQMKKWKKAKKHYQTEQQIRMEREFGAMGGFGGGFGGGMPGGGGFGGGMPGGGFPGGGGFGF
ncbi:MAG: DUF4890 domain-containing protein [Bacteroidales bacterium]|jgi:hypothetical protein|nr:DUF4890 domain-containing protein [Bacteroidales bacterium]